MGRLLAAGEVAGVGSGEGVYRALEIEGFFGEVVDVPFAALDGEEIAAVDVDGAGQFVGRVGDRVDDVVAQGCRTSAL